MEIKIANICGLCAGCKYAISSAKNLANSCKNVVLFKEIVHNKNVNLMLENLGIKTADNLNDLNSSMSVILRAHGEPPATYDFLNQNKINFLDCTCQNVKRIHELVAKFSADDYKIIIIGKYGKSSGAIHPEVLGTIGWCKNEPILVETLDDLEKLNDISANKFYLTCQTTFNEALADELILKISQLCKSKNIELVINKSICGAQKAINKSSVELAKDSDIMIVVGGKNSSNTKELFNNVKNYTKAIFIENINDWFDELKNNNIALSKNSKIGLTAGASTMKDELENLKKLIETKQEEL